MHVAKKKPGLLKCPVRITHDSYELWYARPRSLGVINKRNGYWYTEDGMRFVSSRDALEYRIRIVEVAESGSDTTVQIREKVAQTVREEKVSKKKSPEINQKIFEEFLEYMQMRKGATSSQQKKGDKKDANVSI